MTVNFTPSYLPMWRPRALSTSREPTTASSRSFSMTHGSKCWHRSGRQMTRPDPAALTFFAAAGGRPRGARATSCRVCCGLLLSRRMKRITDDGFMQPHIQPLVCTRQGTAPALAPSGKPPVPARNFETGQRACSTALLRLHVLLGGLLFFQPHLVHE